MQNAITACRFCGSNLNHTFADLGMSPLANSYIKEEDLFQKEAYFPLKVLVCESCYLVQLPVCQAPEDIFNEYAYFSSYSDSWLNHAKAYVDVMITRFGYGQKNQVIEIASNDGYLLQYFQEKSIPVLGIEPAHNVAHVAIKAGIPTLIKYFGSKTAHELSKEGKQADLLIGNNVLAHVPELNDFVQGLRIILKKNGVITMEFPHLMRLMEANQFDTIYHEHFSYFSFTTVEQVFERHGLILFDVEELPTHGGSLRIYARHKDDRSKPIGERVLKLKSKEQDAGIKQIENYTCFSEKVKETKRSILEFLIKAKRDGKSIAGYGAPAKGNTLLNFCGVGTDFIDYTLDRSPHKQGHYLPGSHIPICHPDTVKQSKPDYLVIFPWNLKEEIIEQMNYIREWGCQFVVLIPEPKVYS
jgi:hypothetical protein